ncbi:MAG: fumarylacetoacetate hydrolase family protein [Acidimicrobiales bacterium]|nr:fumarylacetoacetate hydrolase family protein [Acidimicrobiales bacterium]
MRMANVGGRASLVVDGRVVDVERASGGELSSDPMVVTDLAVHPRLRELLAAAEPWNLPELDPTHLGPPVPRPGKIVAAALNYRSHAEESRLSIPDEPHVFAKLTSCVAGPFDPIVVPAGRDQVDFEAEIVVVVGRTMKAVAERDVWSHLAGVTCGQDVSDRGEQFRPPARQFTLAKSYDTFGPIGPVLVSPDALDDRDDIGIVGRVDGAELQRSSSSDLIFSVPALLAWLTRFVTFHPGDLVFTGTPGGVGESRTPPVFLRPGMVVETEIPGVGVMRNPVVAG